MKKETLFIMITVAAVAAAFLSRAPAGEWEEFARLVIENPLYPVKEFLRPPASVISFITLVIALFFTWLPQKTDKRSKNAEDAAREGEGKDDR